MSDTASGFDLANDFPSEPKPRLWPVFATLVIAVSVILAAQIMGGVVIALCMLASGMNPDEIERELAEAVTRPDAFILLGLLSQIPLGLAAMIPAYLSPVPFRERLGLLKPVLPAWGYPVVILGSILPAAFGLGLALLLAKVYEPSGAAARLYADMTWTVAPFFLLFITLSPGFFEEMLFRGYMQRRLLQRWPAWLAILVASALFAIIHFEPHTVVFAFPIGIWLGVLAWRLESIWPTILCHAFINGFWNVYQIGVRLADWPADVPDEVAYSLGSAVIACFLLSIWIVVRHPGSVRMDEKFSWDVLKSPAAAEAEVQV